jgi:N6-L-threonylcarbamoyladenine synthase
MPKTYQILAIETSCDETAAAVLQVAPKSNKLLSNIISSQEKIHAQFGGIVPEVAARLHIEKILPVIDLALQRANTTLEKIDYLAVCYGPGLVSSLMIGVETMKTLAFTLKKPLIKINHLEAHLLSAELESKQSIKFPCVGLIVSGGHTQIIYMPDYLKYKLIGETRDDAAGEAYDKCAKILGLGYPGGPAIDIAAGKAEASNSKFQIKLPRPMINKGFDMSFSGLKTAVLYAWQDMQKTLSKKELENAIPIIAKEFQQAAVEVLVSKTLRAAEKYKAKTVVLGGGVSASKELKQQMAAGIIKQFPKTQFLAPEVRHSGDNAAMIAQAAYYHIKKRNFTEPFSLRSDPNSQLV